jgi:hypothetical protein
MKHHQRDKVVEAALGKEYTRLLVFWAVVPLAQSG